MKSWIQTTVSTTKIKNMKWETCNKSGVGARKNSASEIDPYKSIKPKYHKWKQLNKPHLKIIKKREIAGPVWLTCYLACSKQNYVYLDHLWWGNLRHLRLIHLLLNANAKYQFIPVVHEKILYWFFCKLLHKLMSPIQHVNLWFNFNKLQSPSWKDVQCILDKGLWEEGF